MSKKTKSKTLLEVDNTNTQLEDVQPDILYRIQEVRHLTDTTYVLRFDRHGLDFRPGQHITLGLPGDTQLREYSIYSPNNVDYLEVLIKEVEDGDVSKKLKKLKAGGILKVEGPFGFFTIDTERVKTHKAVFVASGTGIAPFHSMIKSNSELNYTVLHGIRYNNESYERHEYIDGKYISCTSRDENGDFQGRVTDYLSKNNIDSNTLVYLCGNYEMIQSAYDILTNKGLSTDNIRTEVYF